MNKGDVVTNRKIKDEFGVSPQGGMRRSLSTNSLVLITGTANSLYEDTWNNGVLKYTGTGRVGDQTMAGQNKVLAESTRSGIGVHLFTGQAKNQYRYDGEVKLSGAPARAKQLDALGHMRSVWMFTLRPLNFTVTALPEEDLELEPSPADQSSINALVSAAEDQYKLWAAISEAERIAEEKGPRYIVRMARAIERNPKVAKLVKLRENYRCQICGAEGFGKKDGGLYAEAHHEERISELAPDAPSNMICVCPTCHRVLHYGAPESLALRRSETGA
jgi:5-methylcytosine-specific restriction protein A